MPHKPNPANYDRAVAITTSDTVAIASGVADAVIFTTTGNAVLIDSAGNSITVTGAPVCAIVPARIVRVNATGTTATLAALYAQ